MHDLLSSYSVKTDELVPIVDSDERARAAPVQMHSQGQWSLSIGGYPAVRITPLVMRAFIPRTAG